MNDQPMCQRPDVYCGKCDTCNPKSMTREQRIQEVIQKITEGVPLMGHQNVVKLSLTPEKLAAFLVDEVLGRVIDTPLLDKMIKPIKE